MMPAGPSVPFRVGKERPARTGRQADSRTFLVPCGAPGVTKSQRHPGRAAFIGLLFHDFRQRQSLMNAR